MALSSIHNITVPAKVMYTTAVLNFPAGFSSELSNTISSLLRLKRKSLSSMNHETKIITITNGTISIIHSPKPMPMLSPFGSLRYLRAMAFGGVPMGVPMPPMLAPTATASARAILPLPAFPPFDEQGCYDYEHHRGCRGVAHEHGK